MTGRVFGVDSRVLMRVALNTADRGMFVFPLWPRSKVPAMHGADNCPGRGICALGHRGWEARATRDPEVIRRWWRTGPLNVGIAVGRSGLHVLDLDAAHGESPPTRWAGAGHGRDVLTRLADQAGEPYPDATRIVGTPSGGLHLYFVAPPLIELRNTVARAGWRVDSRGSGGYVVAAGSTCGDGRYEVLSDHPIAPLPAWLVRLLVPPPTTLNRSPLRSRDQPLSEQRRTAYLQAIHDSVAAARPGTRHNVLLRAAFTLGRLVKSGDVADQEAHECLRTAAARWRGSPSRKDIQTIEDGLEAGNRRPRRLAG